MNKVKETNFCVYDLVNDEARHTLSKEFAQELFSRIEMGYISQITDGCETILDRKSF